MKIAIVLCAFVGAAIASPYLQSYGKEVNTGRSSVMRKDDGHGNYEFGYDEDHHSGGTSRREKGGKGWQTGSYELRDRDGRKRTVKYVADAHGFRAQIDTNEQGVDAKEDPADVNINKSGYLAQPIYIKSEPQYYSAPKIAYAEAPQISYAAPMKIATIETGHSWPSGYESSWSGPSESYGSNSYGSSYGNSYGKY